jgi:hypothetical protein
MCKRSVEAIALKETRGRFSTYRVSMVVVLVVTLTLLWSPGLQSSAGGSPAASSGNVLLLSDIHFDPLADPIIAERLLKTPAVQWQAVFAASTQEAYARTPNDTNYSLLKSALSAAAAQKPFDFVIASGDYLRHDFRNAFIRAGGSPDDFPIFASKTAVFIVDMIQTTFGGPVYFALGNDDSNCADYGLVPGSAFLGALADALSVLANNPEANADFRTAGFYELPHPILPDQEILVLNSVLWSPLYSNCGSDGADPGAAEMDWLSWKLYQAKIRAHKVILVMHIPPGVDTFRSVKAKGKSITQFWLDRYFGRFLELMQSYGGIVQIALAGHTHMDDFRVLNTSSAGPSVAFRITPAISPIFGNNPAFSVLHYSVKTGAVSQIATYYLDLARGGDHAQWTLEYTFPDAYGYNDLTPTNLQALAASIHDNPQVRQIYAGYYAASAPSPITSTNWTFYSCAETRFTSADYSDCACNPKTSHEPSKPKSTEK